MLIILSSKRSLQNVVGYETHSLDLENPDDYIFDVGVNFKNVTGEPYVVTDTFLGNQLNDGDTIFIFDNLMYGYNLYTYGEIDTDVWGFSVVMADGSFGEPITSLTLNKGDWALLMPADLELTSSIDVAGEVEKSGTKVLDLSCEDSEDGYICPLVNPFPINTTLGDLKTFLVDGDTIFVWDSVLYGYNLYTYGEIDDGVFGFSVVLADGSFGDPISGDATVILKSGQGALFMPADFDGREWSVTLNY